MVENITIGTRSVSVYAFCAFLGLLVTGLYAVFTARQRKLEGLNLLYTLLWAALGAFLGSRLLYALTNLPFAVQMAQNAAALWERGTFFRALGLLFSGSVFYGGLLGGLLCGTVYARSRQLPVQEYLDITASVVPLFHVFGRMGCFLTGCCYGVESPVGFVYHHAPIPMANGVTRFPIQLVEAGCNLLLFLLLWQLLHRHRCSGKLLWLYLLLYGTLRFVLEWFRGDTYRGFLWGLFTSQWISLILIGVAVIVLFRHPKPSAMTEKQLET